MRYVSPKLPLEVQNPENDEMPGWKKDAFETQIAVNAIVAEIPYWSAKEAGVSRMYPPPDSRFTSSTRV